MADYPILMSGALVRALVAGRKTQSRRLPTPTWDKVRRLHDAGEPVRLWVREAGVFRPGNAVYRADGGAPDVAGWSPSIHMPRAFSRLTLAVTAVRRERLQAITDADCRAEGAAPAPGESWRDAFRRIWDSLHPRAGERWADDPEVCVLAFTVHLGNIDGAKRNR